MKAVKKSLKKVLCSNKLVLQYFLIQIMKLHNLCYSWIGRLACQCSKDAVHPKHRLLRYHEWFLEHIDQNDSVLDIGCGQGMLAYDIAKKVVQVTAVDSNEANIAEARLKYFSHNIEYICADIMHYSIPSATVAILSNVLEHIEYRDVLLQALHEGKVQKILVRVPSIERDWLALYKKEMNIEWRLDKTHFIEYTEEQIRHEIEKAGFMIDICEARFGEYYIVAINNKGVFGGK